MIWINGIRAADPSKLDIGTHRISRASRTASGMMVMDIIAIKRTVALEYNLIEGTVLEAILNNLESRTFSSLRYPDPQSGERIITVYVGDISKTSWYILGGIRYWQDVKIPLIEQ